MKSLVAIVALLLLTAAPAAAQDHAATPAEMKAAFAERVRPRMDVMFKDIKVTPTIIDKTIDIFMKASDNASKIDPKAKDADKQIAANTKWRNDSIKALLASPADKAKFDANNEAYLKSRK